MARWQTKGELKDLVSLLVKVPSISGTKAEIEMARTIHNIIYEIPYFQQYEDYLKIHKTSEDTKLVTALVKSKNPSKKTIILMSHFDVVDIEDYGDLKKLAFHSKELTKYFYQNKENLSEEIITDLDNGEWLFGRGVMDMKGGLALHMSLLEQASEGQYDSNILLLTVPDEERNSVGMRSAVPVLLELQQEFDLEYEICLTSEPMFTKQKNSLDYYIYSGSIGKILPGFYSYGTETHVGEPFRGLNANLMASELTAEIEIHPKFQEEMSNGEFTPNPTTLLQKDLKDEYSTQIPHKAVQLFNFFLMKKSLKELTDQLLESANIAARRIENKYLDRLKKYGVTDINVKVYTYQQLLEYAIDTYGYEKVKGIEKSVLTEAKGKDDRKLTIQLIDAIATLCRELSPMIILFFAPPFYTPVHSQDRLSGLIDDIRKFALKVYNIEYKHQNFYPGISDLSYASLSDNFEVEALSDNMPLLGKTYTLPINELKQLNLPVLNLGVLGKDPHKWSERLELNFSFITLKKILEYTIKGVMPDDINDRQGKNMSEKIKNELIDIYNNHADERYAAKKQPYKLESRQLFVSKLKEAKVRTILDVGSGTGQDSLFFQKEGFQVTAIDLSEEHVKYCRQQGIDAYEMDVYSLSFPDESFDALYSLNCLVHIPSQDLDHVLLELKRVLKDNGLFYLGVYGGRRFEGKNEKDNYPEKRFFSFHIYEEYIQRLQHHFELIQTEKVSLENDFEFHYFILKKMT